MPIKRKRADGYPIKKNNVRAYEPKDKKTRVNAGCNKRDELIGASVGRENIIGASGERQKKKFGAYGERNEEAHICAECGAYGEIEISKARGVFICKACALELYKRLGSIFIPRSLPNIVAKSVAAAKDKAEPLELKK